MSRHTSDGSARIPGGGANHRRPDARRVHHTRRVGRAAVRRSSAVTALTVVSVLLGGTAFAYWVSSGSGLSSAAVGTTGTITVTGALGGTLFPGGPSQPLALTLTNSGAQPVTVTTITGSVSAASGGSGACTPAASGVLVASTTVSVVVPASGSKTLITPKAVSMSTSSPTGCQGATFTYALEASGRVG